MVKIRVKVIVHDGASKKANLIRCICEADALVNKIIASEDAFFFVN